MKQTIVLLPGWTGVEEDYQKLIDSAPKDMKVLVVDYQKMVTAGHLETFNENFLNYLDKNNLSKIILVGVSLGGIFSIKFTVAYPKKVEQLILVDAEGVPGGENFFQAVANLIRSRQNQKYQPKVPYKNIWEFIRSISLQLTLGIYGYKGNVLVEAKHIFVPTTIMWGEEDCLVSVSQAQILQSLIPKSKLIILKDWGHDWISFFPEKFWENI